MWIASIPAAAAPLPGVAPAVATPGGAPAEGAQFDDALAASLDVKQPVPSSGAPAPEASRFKLVNWLLSGVAVEAAPAGPAQSAASETLVEEDLDAAEEADEDVDEVPAEALLMGLTAPQQPALELSIVPAEIPAAQPVVAQDPEASAGSRQDAAPALSAAMTPNASTAADMTAPPQDVAEDEVKAAEPQAAMRQDAPIKSALAHRIEAEVSASVVRSTGATAPAVASSAAEARQSAGAQAPALPVGTLEVAPERDAEVSASAGSAAGARPMTGVTVRGPVVTVEEPRATESAASATSAAEAAPVADVVPMVENAKGESHDAAMTMPRALASGAPQADVQTPMGGGDARSFENDGRRSPAAQRLAAALSKAGPAISRESGGGAAAPAFSIPIQPVATATPAPSAAPAAIAVPVQVTPAAAQVAPVVVAAPATAPASVDVENVHNLVEAMRITAKAGGWEATVRLKPEHMGEVTIALRVDGKSVSAVVQAESAGVRQWLTSQEEAVRSGLSEHGLQLDRFAVSKDGQRREAEQQQQQEQPRRRAPRQADAGSQPRFEVVV